MKNQSNMKPILFSTPMVQAILDGKKTQTRRIAKWSKKIENPVVGFTAFTEKELGEFAVRGVHENGEYGESIFVLPYKIGDVLYVRETFAAVGCIGWPIDKFEYNYKADYINGKWSGYADMCFEKWSPSIHMPKDAARIFLRITAVKAERLQDISEADAIAEGVESFRPVPGDGDPVTKYKLYDKKNTEKPFMLYNAKSSFISLWKFINGHESWNQNPWVWAYTFERCERPQSEIVNPKSAIL